MNKFLKLSIVGLTILLGACSCSSNSKKLTCTQHIDVLGFIAEEKVVMDIGEGTLNSVSISRNYDLAKMIESGSTKEEVASWAETYKGSSDIACNQYKDCKVNVDYQENDYLKVDMTISGKDFLGETTIDLSGKSSSEIYNELKTGLESTTYTCK